MRFSRQPLELDLWCKFQSELLGVNFNIFSRWDDRRIDTSLYSNISNDSCKYSHPCRIQAFLMLCHFPFEPLRHRESSFSELPGELDFRLTLSAKLGTGASSAQPAVLDVGR